MFKDNAAAKLARVAEMSRRLGSLKENGVVQKLAPDVLASLPLKEMRRDRPVDEEKLRCSYGL